MSTDKVVPRPRHRSARPDARSSEVKKRARGPSQTAAPKRKAESEKKVEQRPRKEEPAKAMATASMFPATPASPIAAGISPLPNLGEAAAGFAHQVGEALFGSSSAPGARQAAEQSFSEENLRFVSKETSDVLDEPVDETSWIQLDEAWRRKAKRTSAWKELYADPTSIDGVDFRLLDFKKLSRYFQTPGAAEMALNARLASNADLFDYSPSAADKVLVAHSLFGKTPHLVDRAQVKSDDKKNLKTVPLLVEQAQDEDNEIVTRFVPQKLSNSVFREQMTPVEVSRPFVPLLSVKPLISVDRVEVVVGGRKPIRWFDGAGHEMSKAQVLLRLTQNTFPMGFSYRLKNGLKLTRKWQDEKSLSSEVKLLVKPRLEGGEDKEHRLSIANFLEQFEPDFSAS
jgi:hypothetical protein